MTILKSLLNLDLLASDAKVLEQHYGNEPEAEFLDGLDQIARALAFADPPGLVPPITEPWKSIHLCMMDEPKDLDKAYNTAIASLGTDLQVAIGGAVNVRMNDLRQWQAQNVTHGKRRKSAQYIKILKNLGYRFAYNLCTHNIEVNGLEMDDGKMMEIRSKVRDLDIYQINIVEDTYIAEAHANKYHPIRDYLMSLRFDGGDPIGEFCTYVQDEYGLFPVWFRRFLVGAVARVMCRTQNRVLVMDGKQGIGKSEIVRWLTAMVPEYYYEGPINPDDKDCRLRRLSIWLWEVSEFGVTTRKADREALKAFISTEIVRDRKSYGRYDVQGNAMASFIGTFNDEAGVFSDPTGSRRFMTSHILSIDWDYKKNIDVDQIWAQAYDLYLTDEPWNLTVDERQMATEVNDLYQVVDIVEESVKTFFDIDPANSNWWMSTTEIMEMLKDPQLGNLKTGVELNTRRLAAALTHLGLDKPKQRKINNQPIRGYYGIRRAVKLP